MDSSLGFAVTGDGLPNDSNYIIKTTNSGNNWYIAFSTYRDFYKIQFINQNTGFVCGGLNVIGGGFFSTTNGGINWAQINSPFIIQYKDMAVLNKDTIILVDDNNLEGGVYTTMNGGVNWTVNNSIKPDKIYMYNSRIGFCSRTGTSLYKTTNGGVSWNTITGENGFRDIHFIDSLTGWKANGTLKKTTDGGLNWSVQVMPSGGIFTFTGASKIAVINRDTIFATGGAVQCPNLESRGVVYRTTNGGDTWKFQVPDTTLHTGTYFSHLQFINYSVGWAYTITTGIHTTTGGDTNWLLPLTQISAEVPKEFRLYQNYPNPFNPKTKIKYQITKNNSFVQLTVYDITGREIVILVNQKQNAGTYEVEFSGNGYASGVYFYKMVKEGYSEIKKMVLLK